MAVPQQLMEMDVHAHVHLDSLEPIVKQQTILVKTIHALTVPHVSPAHLALTLVHAHVDTQVPTVRLLQVHVKTTLA